MTMAGQAIHGGPALQGPKEPFLSMLWAHFWCFVSEATSQNCVNLSSFMSVNVLSARITFLR